MAPDGALMECRSPPCPLARRPVPRHVSTRPARAGAVAWSRPHLRTRDRRTDIAPDARAAARTTRSIRERLWVCPTEGQVTTPGAESHRGRLRRRGARSESPGLPRASREQEKTGNRHPRRRAGRNRMICDGRSRPDYGSTALWLQRGTTMESLISDAGADFLPHLPPPTSDTHAATRAGMAEVQPHAVDMAVDFVSRQPGGATRILSAHHVADDGYCAGCFTIPTRWPCSTAGIALAAQRRAERTTPA